MNRPPSMIGSGQPGSVPSPIQHHNSPLPPPPQQQPQHSMMAQRPAMMTSMPPQQQQMMSNPVVSGMQPGMVPGMMSTQQHQPSQQQQQPMPMIPQTISKQYLCRAGADTVQDIVSKALELFQHLRSMTPQLIGPNQQCEDRKNKIKETTKYIENSFKKLRKIYEALNETNNSTMDFVDPLSTLPLKDDDNNEENNEEEEEDKDKILNEINGDGGQSTTESIVKNDPNKTDLEKNKLNPKYQQLEKDYKDLVELNKLKNRQLKEIIDRIRKMVWDINTMLAMRRP